jgi:hypothetical protein
MKNNYLKINAALLLVCISLTLAGCLKNDSESRIITEPPTWDYTGRYLEIQRQNDAGSWVDITEGRNFTMQWSYQDASKAVIVGRFQYNFTRLGVKLDTTGALRIKDNKLSFISLNTNGQLTDSAAVAYTQDSDSTIILRNNSITPAIAIRYKKLKTP